MKKKRREKTKIGIVGHGFVGQAMEYLFNVDVQHCVVDPKYKTSVIADLKPFEPELVFICAPTPSRDDGTINYDIVEQCIQDVHFHTDAIIVLKSTVTPDHVERFSSQYYDRFVYNPEFLTERDAKRDAVNPHMIVLGGDRELTGEVVDYYIHSSCGRPAPVFHMSAKEAAYVKYGINTFLASKIAIFNELSAHMNRRDGANYNRVVNAIGTDPRVGHSHTVVPGYDGKPGFGGACFPKDLTAFINSASSDEFSILRTVNESNRAIRSALSLDDREREQNIRFN